MPSLRRREPDLFAWLETSGSLAVQLLVVEDVDLLGADGLAHLAPTAPGCRRRDGEVVHEPPGRRSRALRAAALLGRPDMFGRYCACGRVGVGMETLAARSCRCRCRRWERSPIALFASPPPRAVPLPVWGRLVPGSPPRAVPGDALWLRDREVDASSCGLPQHGPLHGQEVYSSLPWALLSAAFPPAARARARWNQSDP